MATVTITGNAQTNWCNIVIDGVKYTSVQTIDVPIGTVITCNANDKYDDQSYVQLNGITIANGDDRGKAIYNYTVVGNVMITLTYVHPDSDTVYGIIAITEKS